MTSKTLDEIRHDRRSTAVAKHAYNRHLIEHTTGVHIHPRSYDRFNTAQKRRRLIHFTDCHNLESAIAHDKKQIEQHTPFSARDNRTAKAVQHHTLITAVSGAGDYVEGLRRLQNNEFSGDELAAQLGDLFATRGAEFRRVFGRGRDLPSDDAVVLFRWYLKQASI